METVWSLTSYWQLALTFTSVVILYLLSYVIYNVYYHPLSNYPGPLLAKSGLLWRMTHSMTGRFHRSIYEQHQRYGPIFRVSPNELSFASAKSYKDIYGYKSDTAATLNTHVKSDFYKIYGAGYKTWCIGSERDPKKQMAMKRQLSPAFSPQALLEQEVIVSQCVDQFIEKVDSMETARTEGIDMTLWFEMGAFDLFGEMAFGESFGAIEKGEPHVWPSIILSHIWYITLMDNLRRYPWLMYVGSKVLPSLLHTARNKHGAYTREKLRRRLSTKSTRKDFLTEILDQVETGRMGEDEMTAHVSTLVIAGGETTSTFLASVSYFLLKTPKAHRKLREELHDAFKSYDEINAPKAQSLPYLQAVIQEGLRIHPPGSYGFPRVSAGAFIDGHWVPKGTEMYTSSWAVTHNSQYFHEPFAFKPERWLDPACEDLKEASKPFSLGPRDCLGKHFALFEVSLLLAKLHYRFDLELMDQDLDWERECNLHVMWRKPELMVRVLGDSRSARPT